MGESEAGNRRRVCAGLENSATYRTLRESLQLAPVQGRIVSGQQTAALSGMVARVYVFAGRRLIKIGISADPITRMKGIGEPVKLLAWAYGTRSEERWLHVVLKKDRVRGEWFRPTAEVLYVARHLQRFAHARMIEIVGSVWGRSVLGRAHRQLLRELASMPDCTRRNLLSRHLRLVTNP